MPSSQRGYRTAQRSPASPRVLALLALLSLAGLQVLGRVDAAGRLEAGQAALQQFRHAVDAYRQVRQREEAKIGPLPRSSDPAVITNRQHRLGEAIRQARAGARQGDVFTPAVAQLLRRLIAADLTRRRQVDRRAFIVSIPDVQVHVNEFYPTTVPLATVPPRLLAILPQLPEDLEYRFAGDALILRDVDPNLVVDVLPGAIPARMRKQR